MSAPRRARRYAPLLLAAAVAGLAVGGGSALARRADGDGPRRAVPPRAAPTPEVAGAPRPDIVLLVLDDLPEMDLRVLRRLPTISRLFLDGGVRFTRHMGNDPLCCPGRATLFTGLRSRDHGVIDNDGRTFDPSVTIATELSGAGYRTAILGKYLNRVKPPLDVTPPGWDRVLTGLDYYGDTWWDDGRPYPLGRRPRDYSVDLIARRATRWIARRGPATPAFLYLSPYTVHPGRDERGRLSGDEPVVAPRHRGDARCAGIAPWRTPAHGVLPDPAPAWLAGVDPARRAEGRPLTAVCEALLAVDDMVAAVEAAFLAAGRTDVAWILTADNGMSWGRFGWERKLVPWAVPLPMLVRWPAGSSAVPRSVAVTTSATDIAPTLCALAGCVVGPVPSGAEVAGVSLLPLLAGTAGGLARTALPTEQLVPGPGEAPMPAWQGIVTTEAHPAGRWAYVRYADGSVTLTDLAADPWGLTDRAADPALADLRTELAAAWATFHDPLPVVPWPPPSPAPTSGPSASPRPGDD
ncbi:MAG: sulfatase-like hydrolase/transferase [Chloroflexota bacterium]